MKAKVSGIGYVGQPRPKWWSPWRKWRRNALLIAPVVLGLAAIALTVSASTQLGPKATPAFAGALIGATVAVFGNFLVQYLQALIQERRWQRERSLKELALSTTITTELGEAVTRMNINLALMKSKNADAIAKIRPVRLGAWESLQLQAAEYWMPASIFTLATTFAALRFINDEIEEHSDRLSDADFQDAVEKAVMDGKGTLAMLERRQLRVGRE